VGWNLTADRSCGISGPGDLTATDPQLGPLQDNGGPTLTRAPSVSSPAIDAMFTCALVDQRGITRPQGAACDVGAVERELAAGAPHFSDVPVSHLFFWEVECLVGLGVTNGFPDGTFRPGLPISRQGTVAWLWRLAGEPAPAGDPGFTDVPADSLFADAIAWASEEGIVEGYADGTFRPHAEVARQGVAAWLWRFAGEPPVVGDPPFSDVPSTSTFADAIAWAAEAGVTEGYDDGTFRPAQPISRQGVAAWLCRYDEQTS
jgi:hypothetical protein